MESLIIKSKSSDERKSHEKELLEVRRDPIEELTAVEWNTGDDSEILMSGFFFTKHANSMIVEAALIFLRGTTKQPSITLVWLEHMLY